MPITDGYTGRERRRQPWWLQAVAYKNTLSLTLLLVTLLVGWTVVQTIEERAAADRRVEQALSALKIAQQEAREAEEAAERAARQSEENNALLQRLVAINESQERQIAMLQQQVTDAGLTPANARGEPSPSPAPRPTASTSRSPEPSRSPRPPRPTRSPRPSPTPTSDDCPPLPALPPPCLGVRA